MSMYRHILAVRTDKIGDVVLTIPSLRALKKAFPSAKLTVLVAAGTRELVLGLPFVDEVLSLDQYVGVGGYLRLVIDLYRRRFDLAVVYHTKYWTNILCTIAGIPERLGYKNDKCGFLLTKPVKDHRSLGEKHEVEYCLDLLKKIGIHSNDLSLELPVDRTAEEWTNDLWDRYSLHLRPVVVLHPDASCPTRRWPPQSFARLAERLTLELGVRVVIVGARSARGIAVDIIDHFHEQLLDLTGQVSMAQLISLFSRSRLVISNDSGPAHIAAAVGTPLITLFMRTQPGINPERWKPLGKSSYLIKNHPGEELVLDRHSNIISGKLDSITVDEVFAKAKELLAR